jgi:hypothetical protein
VQAINERYYKRVQKHFSVLKVPRQCPLVLPVERYVSERVKRWEVNFVMSTEKRLSRGFTAYNENYSACHLLSRWFLAQLSFSGLKMEAICSSETLVDFQRNTRRNIPENDTLHNHRCENLKSYIVCIYFYVFRNRKGRQKALN